MRCVSNLCNNKNFVIIMISWWKLFKCSLLILLLFQSVQTRKPEKKLLFQNARTSFNSEYVDDYYIEIKSKNQTLDFGFTLNKDLTQDLWHLVAIVLRSRIIYGYDVNFCTVLRQEWTNKLNLINSWIQSVLLRYGDLPQKCPIEKGTYTWHNINSDQKSILSFAASGRYTANVLFYLRKQKLKVMVLNSSVDYVIV